MTGPPRNFSFQITYRTVQYLGPCVGVFVGCIFAGQTQAADASLIWEADMTFTQLRAVGYILENDLATHIDNGKVCVDLKQFVRAIEAPVKVDTNTGNASGWYLTEARVFDLNLSTHKLTSDGILSVLSDDDVRMTELGPCVALTALQKWFPVDFAYKAKDSSLTIIPREKLPILARVEREEARKKINDYRSASLNPLEEAPDIAYRMWSVPSFDISLGTTLSKQPDTPVRRNFNYTVSSLGEFAHMTAETFLQSDSGGAPRSLRARLYRDDLRGNIFFKNSGITQFSIGDVSSGGNGFIGGGATGRGISVSTFPLALADEYDRTTLRGDLPDGWEAELYRNDALISYLPPSGNGRYEFTDVPVFFGLNKFRVVLYGPQGQRRDIEKAIDTGQIVTPRGQWHMRFSALQKNVDTIPLQNFNGLDQDRGSWRYDADVRTGLFNGASVGIGTSSYIKNEERLWFGSLSLQTTVAQSTLELEGVKDKGSGWGAQATVSRNFGNIGARVRYARYGGDFESERIDRNSRSRLEASLSLPLRLAHNYIIPMALRGSITESAFSNDSYALNWSASAGLAGMSMSTALNYASNGNSDSLRGSFALNKRLDSYIIRAQTEYTVLPQAELVGIRVGFDRSSRYGEDGWHYGGDISWSVPQKQGDVSASLTRRFDKFSLSAQASTSTRGGFGVGLSLTTSLGREPIYNRWRAASRSFNSGGNVAVRVFEDLDGDNVYGTGDRPIVGARIQRNSGLGTSSNGDGVVLVDGLAPYQPVKLLVDPDSISDGDLAQSNIANNSVVPRPGAVGKLDIPMVLAGGVEGEISLTQNTETTPIPGLTVEMLSASGDVLATTHTEFDGFFFFERVPVGDYRVRVSPAQVKALGITGNRPIDVTVNREKPYPSALKLQLFKGSAIASQVASLDLKPLWGEREVMSDAPWISMAAVWGDPPAPEAQPAIVLAAQWNTQITADTGTLVPYIPTKLASIDLKPIWSEREVMSDAPWISMAAVWGDPPAPEAQPVILLAAQWNTDMAFDTSTQLVQTPVVIGKSNTTFANERTVTEAQLAISPSWHNDVTPASPAPHIPTKPVWKDEIAVRRIYYGKASAA
jgi:hypothetical protein